MALETLDGSLNCKQMGSISVCLINEICKQHLVLLDSGALGKEISFQWLVKGSFSIIILFNVIFLITKTNMRYL